MNFIRYSIYFHYIHIFHAEPPTVVASPPPDWSNYREETALKHVYDTVKNQWTTTVVKVLVSSSFSLYFFSFPSFLYFLFLLSSSFHSINGGVG